MSFSLPDQLHTPRMVLRAPRPSDAAAIFAAYTQDSDVARYMTWRPHRTLAETETYFAYCMQAWESGRSRPYILALQASVAVPIGMLEARMLPHAIDLGYVLARAHWGAGLMPEAVRALGDAALALAGCFRVQATCDVDNHASARTAEKAGLAREGRLERYIVHPNLDAEPRACFLYARCR
ncbi:MAG: GNAT family N-acetyltransferase [Pseudomonadota bacterium]|nr:GNAT family N-acetyltransferase [Pseudomonadota bacterium]